VLPTYADFGVIGALFEVDFDHVHRNSKRLIGSRLGYKVKHKSLLKGGRKPSPIWQYGVELEYLEDNMSTTTKLWLCKQCHLARHPNDAKVVNGCRHVAEHMRTVHLTDPATGLLPETPTRAVVSDPLEAARMAGSAPGISHTPWQEDALQSALVDWVVVKDVSFANATSAKFRGLLTWNRSSLLSALPKSSSTIRQYIFSTLSSRRSEVAAILQAAKSRISVSVDIWISSNHLSFVGVVAYFVNK
jgi:hypothetical protein